MQTVTTKGPAVFMRIPKVNSRTGIAGSVKSMVVAQVAKGGQGLQSETIADFTDAGSSKEAYVNAMSGRGGAGADLGFLDGIQILPRICGKFTHEPVCCPSSNWG